MSDKRNFDSFDEFADNYRQIHNENINITGVDSDYFSEHKIKTVKIYENNSFENFKILDFGCGDGNSYSFFKTYFPTSSYKGIDISSESINVAESKFENKNDFKVFNGIEIPFEDQTFDIVFIACVLHHINEELHTKIFHEIHRVLKTNGRLYIFEHNPYNPITRHIVNTCPFDKDAVLLPPYKLKKTLKSINYNSISLNFILFFPRHKIFNFLIRVEKFLTRIPLGGQYFTRSIKK
jgi:ubiquinone/menaquinone biosynthesis C-methylase UbiE